MGMALWLVPSASDAARIKQLMRVPRALEPLGYTLPSFDPHITLASFPSSVSPSVLHSAVVEAIKGFDEIPKGTSKLIDRSLKPLHVEQSGEGLSVSSSSPSDSSVVKTVVAAIRCIFSALVTDTHFFRSVLLDIVPSEALTRLQTRILEALPEDVKGSGRSPRFPHLSLFYVPDEFAGDRMRIREGLWSECGVESGGEGDAIVTFKVRTKDEDEESEILISGFDAPEIWIASCEEDVESWVVKEKISLVNN